MRVLMPNSNQKYLAGLMQDIIAGTPPPHLINARDNGQLYPNNLNNIFMEFKISIKPGGLN